VTPDLDLHCARLLRSAAAMGLDDAAMEAPAIEALVRDGIRRLGTERALYLRPMMWSREGSPAIIDALPESTALAICLEELPMRAPGPFALTVSPFRRPPPDAALCEAKAACHYPNNARIVREARARGFDNALSLDQQGHVAETASTNAFLVRDGVVMTPVANGTFLAGITRARVIRLLREDGVEVAEGTLTVADFAVADEIFLTGNASKVVPVTRFEDRDLGPSRMAARARALYWDFAHQGRRAA
jgi:branched-chain amino acid aminotransferase